MVKEPFESQLLQPAEKCMRVGFLKISLIYAILLMARFLAFLESKVFSIASRMVLVIIIGVIIMVNRMLISQVYTQAEDNIRVYLWYKTLPTDYFARLERESQEIFTRYQESIKPKPPTKVEEVPLPSISAKSYIVIDVPTGSVLSSKDASTPLPPASTAKLATALASLKIYKLDEGLTVPQFCTQVDGTKAGLLQGQKFLVGDLLKALLVYSAGDAGCALSIGKISYADFVGLMNQVADEAGLRNTKFSNPIGLDDTDGENLASAEDLAKLGMLAVKNDFIREVVRLKEFDLRDLDGKYSRKLVSTNKLLAEIPGSVGVKTGTTTGAGEVLIYEYAKDKTDLVVVVMGSRDRFSDVKGLLFWILKSYEWAK